MDRIEKFEEMMEQIDYFIKNPTDFLYSNIEDPDYQEIIECTRAIIASNVIYLQQKKANIEKLSQRLSESQAITSSPEVVSSLISSNTPAKRDYRDLTEIIEFITYSSLNEETKKTLSHLSNEDVLRIKLHFRKLILDTKKKIKEAILIDPTTDITALQSDLGLYELIIEFMKELSITEESELIEEQDKDYSNIIFVPNGKKSTYLFEDISEYPDRAKEIKLTIDKIIDGYFLKTKDIKPIEGYAESIYEYKHPNGIRILYVVTGQIIHICSLFFKDKQKSTKITNEYEEALTRFYTSCEYVEANFTNPDFHIEQDELKGEVYRFLDTGVSFVKKVGE